MGDVHRAPVIGTWGAVVLAAWLVAAAGEGHYSASLRAAHSVTLAASIWASLLKDGGTTPLLETTLAVVVLELLPDYTEIVAWWPIPVILLFATRVFNTRI